jgi:glycosyltransferase involved in cell wall biosynthesis
MTDVPPASAPRVSVVVCTRNRGEMIAETIRTVLASEQADFELLVIDQSENDETAACLQAWSADPRLRYQRSSTRGLSAARNVGLELARSEIVLMTDDDCGVAPSWIGRMEQLFRQDARVGGAYCEVRVGEFDHTQGFIPGCAVENKLIQRMALLNEGFGMGAGFGVRRSAALDVGSFDTRLGAGARFKSGEEHDLTYRLLLHGYWVACTSDTHVVHYGFRVNADASSLVRGYMLGYGAVFAKLLKCGHWIAGGAYLTNLWQHATRPLLINVVQLKRPLGLGKLASFVEGFARGLATPVDQRRESYR